MKTILRNVLLLVSVLAVGLTSCKKEESQNFLEENFISIENALYHSGTFPESTTDERLSGIEMSDQVMNGAINYITVTTYYEISKFYIGINGVSGYLEYRPENSGTSSYKIYIIPLMISQNFSSNVELILSALLDNGFVTIPSKYPLYKLDTRPGALEVKLAFSNNKDIDLHLFTPSGKHICYWTSEDGFYYGENGNFAYPFGLDIDSNAGCDIDGINKENIYIPEEYVENGIYTVAVDLYENCYPSIPTSWSVTARYNGNMISPATGKNPASGVFEVGAKSSYEENLIEVMTFKISGAKQSRAVLDPSDSNAVKKSDLKISDSPKVTLRRAM